MAHDSQLWCSVVAAHGLELLYGMWDFSSAARNWTHIFIVWQIITHCTTKEASTCNITITTQPKNKKHPITFRMLTSKLKHFIFPLRYPRKHVSWENNWVNFLAHHCILGFYHTLGGKASNNPVFEWMNGLLCQCSECYFRYFHIY